MTAAPFFENKDMKEQALYFYESKMLGGNLETDSRLVVCTIDVEVTEPFVWDFRSIEKFRRICNDKMG